MKFLFFSPFQSVWQHSFPESLIALTLKKAGHDIAYLTCDGIFNKYCLTMSAQGINFNEQGSKKEEVCKRCKRSRDINLSNINAESYVLEQYISDEERNFINETASEIYDLDDDSDFIIKDKYRRYAAYCILIKYKIKDYKSILKKYRDEYVIEYQNFLASNMAAKNFLALHKIDAIFILNTFYPTNRALQIEAEERGIDVYWLHTGGGLHNRLDFMNVGQSHDLNILHSWVTKWNNGLSEQVISSKGVDQVKKHYIELLKGKNHLVYSSGKSSIDQHIPRDKKIITAIMSSADEVYAGEFIDIMRTPNNDLFTSQIEWIKFIIEYVSKRSELFLIIRVHPREFPNKISQITSEQSYELNDLFDSLPENIYVNWPTDEISIYHLAEYTDVCLHYGSSSGREFALLGIPVASFPKFGLRYPYNFSPFYGETREEYLKCIENALNCEWSYETAKYAFRWSALEFYDALWRLNTPPSFHSAPSRSLPVRILNRAYRLIDPYNELKKYWREIEPMIDSNLFVKMIEQKKISKLDFYQINRISETEERETIFSVIYEILGHLYKSDASLIGKKLLNKVQKSQNIL